MITLDLPSECRLLNVQRPPVPAFHTIAWTEHTATNALSPGLVACIHLECVAPLIAAELTRAHLDNFSSVSPPPPVATLKSRTAQQTSKTVYTCSYAKEKKRSAQDKAEAGMLEVLGDKAAAKAAGRQRRTGSISRGLSIKSCECGYKCHVVIYDHLPQQAYVYLFNLGLHTRVGETALCHGPDSLAHPRFVGSPRLSQIAIDYVQSLLRSGTSSRRIISRAHPHRRDSWRVIHGPSSCNVCCADDPS